MSQTSEPRGYMQKVMHAPGLVNIGHLNAELRYYLDIFHKVKKVKIIRIIICNSYLCATESTTFLSLSVLKFKEVCIYLNFEKSSDFK